MFTGAIRLSGLHEPLIDQDTFDRAQALLKQRGEDLTIRAASRAEFLLTGLVRCGRCRRAYVGMSAKGNGSTYHYYACSGRQKLGHKNCDGERIPRKKLEGGILTQLTSTAHQHLPGRRAYPRRDRAGRRKQ